MKDKIIRIYWHKPVEFSEAMSSDLSKIQGLYYITRMFGEKETSLYLGISRYENTIRHRLRGHDNTWLSSYRGKKFVRIGEIVYPKYVESDKLADIIYDAESAILFEPAHKNLFPANIDKRSSYSYSDLYRIENIGDKFELQPSIRMHEH